MYDVVIVGAGVVGAMIAKELSKYKIDKILIEEARARLEAEKLNAQAEVERAKGMAEAMKLEIGTLNSTYNQYLFIRTLEKLADKGDLPQIIYMPSEGLVPVLDVNHSKKSVQPVE